MKVDVLKLVEPNGIRKFVIIKHSNALRDSKMFENYITFKEGVDLDAAYNYMGVPSASDCISDIMYKGFHELPPIQI